MAAPCDLVFKKPSLNRFFIRFLMSVKSCLMGRNIARPGLTINLAELVMQEMIAFMYLCVSCRRFLRLACALAHFYFDTDKDLSKSFRIGVIEQITQKVFLHTDRDQLLSLTSPIRQDDWTVKVPFGTLELNGFVLHTQRRAQLVDRANDLVIEDQEVMGGEPVFKGTRIPVHTIAASLKLGITTDHILEAFPGLGKEMVGVAEVYAKVHPRRGRPHKLSDKHSTLVKLSHRKIAAPVIA